jgi:5'-AMP-activated protein kinase regulatory gamma subunit
MSDTAEVTRAPAAPNPVDGPPSPTNIARYGHEPSWIAQPSTFLLPRGQNRAMQDKPLSAVDKDQLSGLVSEP